MKLKDIKVARIRGGVTFEENFVFLECLRGYAINIRKELHHLNKEEKKLKYEYIVKIGEDSQIEISCKNDMELTIFVKKDNIAFESKTVSFNEKLYFINELPLIIKILLKTMDLILYKSVGFELSLAVPLLKKKGIDFIKNNYLQSMFDKLNVLGEDIKVNKTEVEIDYKVDTIDHNLSISNSIDDRTLIFILDNRCNFNENISNYGEFILNVWKYYEQNFWPFFQKLVESDFVDKHFLTTGKEEK